MRMNRGTTMASKEIMIVARTIVKRTLLPLNLYFANPYPEVAEKNRQSATAAIDTMKLLRM